jgi:hypothetical protein
VGEAHRGVGLIAGERLLAAAAGVSEHDFGDLTRRRAFVKPPTDDVAKPDQVEVALVVAVADAGVC